MMEGCVENFVEAMQNGFCCLHPTDTLPGLSGWPELKTFPSMIEYVKGSRAQKSFVCLAAELKDVRTFWQPLPDGWYERLTALWPGPLTVIWQAREDIAPRLKNDAGTLAIRVPQLQMQDQWLLKAIKALGGLLPSTSVNAIGQPPITDWHAAAEFLQEFSQTFVPNVTTTHTQSNRPSTLISVERDGSYQVLRHGAMDQSVIDAAILKGV